MSRRTKLLAFALILVLGAFTYQQTVSATYSPITDASATSETTNVHTCPLCAVQACSTCTLPAGGNLEGECCGSCGGEGHRGNEEACCGSCDRDAHHHREDNAI